MDSIGQLLSLTNHRTFSERQLARLEFIQARIEANRLYIIVEATGNLPKEWLTTLLCSAHDGRRIYAPVCKIEDALEYRPGQVMLVSEAFETASPYRGELPETAKVLLQTINQEKLFDVGFKAAKP